ncbi:MAG: hypothetical protein COV30_01830 [Candidatus Yanofskybacteria bacterium CG10_big_fil_rev_8_21_14_0_10_37_15]|uniref:Uncharacterized protein n=1 Tax=Candidatus Yanofskybacteria bacterium CG10_big_fil_rev_8_21_14_0_10_37_15 TaxID=1975097 RepID=A0A2H0R5F5_9BACT|nr:MAG: hypothetical protein COV30_01830 [Candidatus Yanofskybacteria bacterium CG10_big_fil_rev_8_21_14_0_10_37_15]
MGEDSTGSLQADSTPSADSGQASSNDAKETAYLRLCRIVVLATVFLVPLFFLPWTTSILELNKQLLLIGLSGAGLILWLLHVVVSGRFMWRSNSIDVGIGLVLGASALAVLFSLTRLKSLFGLSGSLSESLIVIVALSIVYFIAVHSFQDKGKLIKMVMAVSLFLALLYGFLQFIGVHFFGYLSGSVFGFTNSNAFNSIGSVNSLGFLAGAALPFFYRFKGFSTFKYLNIGKIGAFLSLALLIILNWWVLWTVAIAGMVSLIALESVIKKQDGGSAKFRLTRFVFPMTVIVLGVFFMIVNFNLSILKTNLPIEVYPSFNLSGNVAIEVLKKSPVFGYGPENFSLAFDKFGAFSLVNTALANGKFFDSTSQIINFAVGGGVVLLVAMAYLFWTLGSSVVKRMSRLESDHYRQEGGSGVISALIALSVGMFLYPFNLSLMFLFYLLIAITVLVLWSDDVRVINVEERASTSLISSLGFIGGLILVLVGSYFGATIYLSDFKYAKALTVDTNEKAIQILSESINWNGNDDRYFRASSQIARNLLVEELNKRPVAEDRSAKVQNFTSLSINFARRATEIGSKESNNWSNLGSIYQSLIGLVDGVEKLSEDAYLRASDLRPGDASYFNQIGLTYLSSAEFSRQLAAGGGANAVKFQAAIGPALDKAEENFKKATEISTNFGLAIYNLGIVYDRQGKLNESISQLEKILPFNSNQPSLAFELGLLYYRAGQKDKAFNELQRAVLLSPEFANARWYLALILEERLDFESAIKQVEYILSLDANKDNTIVLEKLEQLKTGQKEPPPQKVIDQKPLQ